MSYYLFISISCEKILRVTCVLQITILLFSIEKRTFSKKNQTILYRNKIWNAHPSTTIYQSITFAFLTSQEETKQFVVGVF